MMGAREDGQLVRHLIIAAALTATAAVPASAEWKLAASGGVSSTQSSDLRIRQGASNYTVEGVRWASEDFTMPPWYDITATYFLPGKPNLGFSLGLMHMKVIAKTEQTRRIYGTVDGVPVDMQAPMEDLVQAFSITHGVNYLNLGVVGRLQWQRDERFPDGRIQPYAALGFGPVINHPENKVGGVDREEGYETNRRWGWVGTVGVHYAISQKWGVFSEVRTSHVANHVTVANGSADATLNTSHFATGLAYSF